MGVEKAKRGRGGAPAASLLEISRVLEETARIVREHAGPPPPPEEGAPDDPIDARFVRGIIAARRLRERFLGLPPADAAWSMLLELYASHLEGRRVPQTGLGSAAGVAETTALCITRRLLAAGLFTHQPHPRHKRIRLIGISPEAASRLRAYLAAVSAEAGAA
jgi:hypothetical protein